LNNLIDFNSDTLQVHLQLVKLIDIDTADCSADKLFNAFKHEMLKLEIPFQNIVDLSCDNASVMIVLRPEDSTTSSFQGRLIK